MSHVLPFVRRAGREDAESIYRMICGLENTELNREGFDFVFEKNYSNELIGYFIAEIGGVPVGMVSCHIQALLHHTALVAEVQEMFVYPEFRSKKIGKALMEEAVAYAKSKGAVQLEVSSRSYREDAHRFYQREGFEKSHVKLVRYF